MQFSTDIVSVAVGLLTSIFVTAIAWGTMKAKVGRLERDIEQMASKFVSAELFNAIVSGMKEDLHEMKGDIKKVLSSIKVLEIINK